MLIAYDIHAAMSAPAPGSAPTSVPSALPRRIWTGYFFASPHMPLNTLPSGWSTIFSGGLVSTAKRMISEIANMPIIIGIMPMPPSISVLPNVKRGKRRRIAEPDAGDQQAEQQRHEALQRPVRRHEHGAGEAEQHQPEIFERGELERELGERRRGDDQHRGAEQSADRGEHEPRAERESPPGPCCVIA